jgi:hypothetical protein
MDGTAIQKHSNDNNTRFIIAKLPFIKANKKGYQ